MTDDHILAIKLMNDGYKDKQISEKLEIPMNLVRQWRRDPVFLRERYVDMCLRFGELSNDAVSTLKEVMNNKDARGADRIKAATEILDRAGFVVQKEVKVSLGDSRQANENIARLSSEEIKLMLAEVKEAKETLKIGSAKDVTPDEEVIGEEE